MAENYEIELKEVSRDLREVEAKIRKLSEKRESLKQRKDFLTDKILLIKSEQAGNDDKWERCDFPWNSKLENVMKNTFKLNSFRSNQLSAINATLSKKDCILIMPTGGGKSLCYQLPAVIDEGFTLVISPMLSLIEDQVMQLKSLSVCVEMFHAGIPVPETNRIQQLMIDKKSGLKLLYVTPEKLAKSKRFMSKLQKSYSLGMLARIAIDEVHCCSQWGHDFRTDYQFLSVLKGMFPDVPMIGLTATATTKVILDVQKMLLITGCLIFKSSFNRPNLYYEVRDKPSSQKDCLDLIESLLKHQFKNKSGIIYTTSIKDCEDLRQELRKRGCRVSGYHAQLVPSFRSKVHQKWLSGEYQAVVATIAFGLGIDKPDVRFVIHHSLSKSMENFYQESGRAGRDGEPATCIILYRFADVFKLSSMVFTQQTGLRNLYSVVEYCLNSSECRRKIIASHFDEVWESTDCKEMCDHCRKPCGTKVLNVAEHCRNLYAVLEKASDNDVRLTAQMLTDVWFGKSSKVRIKLASPPFPIEFASNIIAHLLVKDYLQEDFHFTPYSTISYLKKGSKASTVSTSSDHCIAMKVPCKQNGSQDAANKKRRSANDDSVFGTSKQRRVICSTSSSSDSD